MYDKQVRRRRAILAALVLCCFVLLTAYFGESSGGPLKSIQTGAMEVVAADEKVDGVGVRARSGHGSTLYKRRI